MNRFRPNFVFSGGEPFIEDTWKDFMIGDLKFRAVKPCSRCVVTTVNQDTAEKASEPLETLAKFRNAGNKVNFGMNAVGFGDGVVRSWEAKSDFTLIPDIDLPCDLASWREIFLSQSRKDSKIICLARLITSASYYTKH